MMTRAAFGQATIRVSPAASILAGLRYTSDAVSSDQTQDSLVAFTGFSLPHAVKYSIGSARQHNLSGKIGLQYVLADNVNTYASLTRGYKGPQIDNSTLLGAGAGSGTYGTTLVRAEIPTSVELGAKLALWQHRLDLDLAVFHTAIQDFQEQNCTLTVIGALSCIPINVPKVKTKGVELDLRARPVPALQIGMSIAAILDTEYPSGFTFDGIDVGGHRLLYSPKVKSVISGDYTWQLPSDFELKLGGEIVYKSTVRYCNTLDENCAFGGHTVPSLRLGLRAPDDKWGLLLYARNLSDKRVPNAIMYPLPGKGPGSGYAYSLGDNSFRTVGLTMDVRF
jgi:iron complex outermembrane receptor protein